MPMPADAPVTSAVCPTPSFDMESSLPGARAERQLVELRHLHAGRRLLQTLFAERALVDVVFDDANRLGRTAECVDLDRAHLDELGCESRRLRNDAVVGFDTDEHCH